MRTYLLYILLFLLGNIRAQEVEMYTACLDKLMPSDSIVMSYLQEKGIPITHNNQIKILKSGTEKFEDLFTDIRQAKHHIHLEYFNFRNDSIANALFDLLAIKAQEGVEVRALFDAFGNWSNSRPLKKKHLNKIRARGIEIYHFDPLRFPYINHIFHRDHRKIAVIDGQIAYTGGMNIADYYIKGLPEIGAWHDMHVRIKGRAVCYLQKIFLAMWNKTTKQEVGGECYYPLLPDSLSGYNKTIAIVDRVPKKMPKEMRRTYAKAIDVAKEKIQIVNPYFLPTHSIKKALKKALQRGIKIEIMLSAKTDIGFTPEGSLYVAHRLLKRGANIYLYNGGFHHSKIMMVDSSFCTVGTTNLDSRSLRYDYEVNAFIFDKETTLQLNNIFEADKTNCTVWTSKEWKKRSFWKRFTGWFANVLTPFL